MRETMFLAIALALVACGNGEPSHHGHEGATAETGETTAHHEEHTEASGPQPTRLLDDGARLYGAELGDHDVTALTELTASPDRYAGQVVRTEGTIERVCQAMGCWMELRAEGVEPVRVPMAGHAFFLPRDVAGHPATVEGRVQLQELSPEARTHLESEGAVATSAAFAIEASSVVVR